MKTATLLSFVVACTANLAGAQIVKGVLVSASDHQPVPYGTVIGPNGAERFADDAGRFSFNGIADGASHFRARMIGYSALDTTIALGPNRASLVLAIAPIAIRLATVPVTAQRGCVATGEPSATTNPQLAAIFEQLNANVERYNLLLEKYPFTYRREEVETIQTPFVENDSLVSVDTTQYDSRARRPYHVGSIVYNETTLNGQTQTRMYLPTFGDLTDSAFVAAHCFAYVGATNNEIQIDFRPADRIAVSDVAGSVYLDAQRYVVRRAVFRLTKPKLVSGAILGLTTTTTFKEVVPLVPILYTSRTEQPLQKTHSKGVDPNDPGRTAYAIDNLHPLQSHIAIESDTVLDHTFIGAPVGGDPVTASAPARAPVQPVAISLACTMPPSFETMDLTIYGTVGGARRGDPNSDRLTLGIRQQFHLPSKLDPPAYGLPDGSKVAPTLTGQVTFTVSNGRLQHIALTATSLMPLVDSALVTAVRRADSSKAFVGVRSGEYTMSLSSVEPDAGTLATDLAHVEMPAVPLAHQATMDKTAPAPALPKGNGTFEFVVDEHGRAIPATLRTLKTSSPEFAVAVGRGLDELRYQPAVAGTCPIKELVRQQFQKALTE